MVGYQHLAAQRVSTGYEFLSIPVSAHSAALGGNTVSLPDNDASLIFTNPAVINNTYDNSLNLNYTSYVASTYKMGASFVKQITERGAFGVAAQLLNYGEMTETNSDFEELGTFSSKDIDIQGGYSYLLNDVWSGGVQVKMLFSNYGRYNSFAVGVDLGLHYYNKENGWSIGIVGQNLGGQIKALHETHEGLPFNFVCGATKKFENAPIRITLTMPSINHWQEVFVQNFSFGADLLLSKQIWVAASYYPLRAVEMRTGTDDSSHGAGLALGGGLDLNKIKLGLAWGKYHVSSSSLIINASYVF